MNADTKMGFTYTIEVLKDGVVVDTETVHNLMPTEGLNHVLSVALAAGAQAPTWYIGLFEANYTPVAGDTAATFPTSATETTTYVESTRVAFVPGAISGGTVTNSASRAEFTSNSNKTVYGAFLTSASGKGATSGVLLSAAKFSTSKTFDSGSVIRVTAGFTTSST
jgi:hypothetical protein